MTPNELIREFERRNHSYLFHACTVTSFLSYCEAGAYRSRAAIEGLGLELTPQPSDEADRRIGVHNDLFLNVFDQHADVHKGRSVTGLNKYGPVAMAFGIGALEEADGEILSYGREITSDEYDPEMHEISELSDFVEAAFAFTRPYAWSDDPSRRPGTPGPNTVLRFTDAGQGVPFELHLDHVILDALPPELRALQDEALEDVTRALGRAGVAAQVEVRECVEACGCRAAYPLLTERQVRRFFYETNREIYGIRLPRQAE